MIRLNRAVLSLLVLLALSACKPELDPPAFDPGRADFSRVVAMGGSAMAGYQDGALYREGQESSVVELIVQGIRSRVDLDFNTPWMPAGEVSVGTNPKPWEAPYQTRSRLGDRTDCEGTVSLGPVKDTLSQSQALQAGLGQTVSGPIHNFCLPGATLADLRDPNLGSGDRSPDHFWTRYGISGQSPVQAGLQLEPSFVIYWPGMQEVFNWASTGGALSPLPDPALFRAQLDSTLGEFAALGAKGVLANIPDIGNIPFFTTIPPRNLVLSASLADSLNDIYDLVGANLNFQEGENGFVVGDPTTQLGYRQMLADEYITLTVPLDSMRCYYMGVLIKLMPDRYTLIRPELTTLRGVVDQMNAAIADLAAKYDFAVADMRGFYEDLNSGITQDAVSFDTEFVSGGYFSLDGYGPHPKGSGLLANVFIRAINAHFDSNVPTVRLDVLRGVLFP